MKLAEARYQDIESAKERRVPLVIPVGTMEYHGPHATLGCDTQIALGLIERLAQERELVIAPPIWYGDASYAVAGREKNTIQVDCDVFESYIYSILESLLAGGWHNIYIVIHHQYEQENLMPMTLACMKAAKKLLMRYLEQTRGLGWWGNPDNAAYYAELDEADNPLNWIKVLPCMSTAAQQATGYDHAGKWECSLLGALLPGSVRLEHLQESDEWFIQDATESSTEIGEQMIELSLKDLRERIR